MIHVRDLSRAGKVQLALKMGMFGVIVLQYLIFVGIIETFDNRDLIKDVISIGTTMILLVFAGTGYLAVWALERASHPAHEEEKIAIRRPWAVGGGAIAGVLVGVSIALLVNPSKRPR